MNQQNIIKFFSILGVGWIIVYLIFMFSTGLKFNPKDWDNVVKAFFALAAFVIVAISGGFSFGTTEKEDNYRSRY